jgi:cyclophilin family peptidyl-prolyl cis-trans isomerase
MDTQETNSPRKFPWLTTIIIIIVLAAGMQWWSTRPDIVDVSPIDAYATSSQITTKNLMHTITIETTKGTIVFETYDADAPKTSENFVKLAQKGYYDGIIFHRVIEGFMIQGGDPTGTGMGGASFEGGKFADELNPATESFKTGYTRGTVAMANAGPNTNGSQFFIMHKDTPLPKNYTIFGKVISGMDVVDAIATTPVNDSDRPLTDVVMKKVTVKNN